MQGKQEEMETGLRTNIGRVPRSLWMVIVRLAEVRFPQILFLLPLNMLKYPFYAGHVEYANETGFYFLFVNWGTWRIYVQFSYINDGWD